MVHPARWPLVGLEQSNSRRRRFWQQWFFPIYHNIRGLKVSESAVAELHRMWADGRRRVEREAKGYDVLSTYHAVRYGT